MKQDSSLLQRLCLNKSYNSYSTLPQTYGWPVINKPSETIPLHCQILCYPKIGQEAAVIQFQLLNQALLCRYWVYPVMLFFLLFKEKGAPGHRPWC